ncbi:acetylornithine transaminase [Verrucosispora sp. WMMA2044]|uniref:acetylornithine transaminase n=1 Tax=Verrucosispora sp. WMMA2044 TaxID=3016419 RepID=UPI00248B81B4|nr:acetylornithine transaminase [Verrucosispora sp. WMMA2044]WBB50393.1 acetylornithine transaminase [Verrucosispora sp. WMMA2044]
MAIRDDGGGRRALTERWSRTTVSSYGTPGLALVKGSGAVVTDDAGREYLDLMGGAATNVLGHAHPAVVNAVSRQAATLGHVSSRDVAEPTVLLGELLLALTGPGRVVFTDSGAEANETAFQVARLTGRSEVVATIGAFHGRTMGTLAFNGQPGRAHPFRTLPDVVTHVPFGDVEALRGAVSDATAMVILEAIQGENGVLVPPPGYLAAARTICTATGALLVLDEVHTALGRTGYWFHHQSEGIAPDFVTLAQGLGGGLPLGACLAFGTAADLLATGAHGTTVGGSPLSCAAGLAVIRTIAGMGLLDHVKRVGDRLRAGIEAVAHPLIAGVRGAGLLLGIALTEPVAVPVTDWLRAAGFLVDAVQPAVIRLAPPLVLTAAQADAFVDALARALVADPGPRPPARLLVPEAA